MKKNYALNRLIFAGAMLSSSLGWGQLTFGYTGESETYVIPAGVALIQIETSGAQGGDGEGGSGGLGATMIGTFEVEEGDSLEIVVGGAGAQFGNSGGGGGGTGVLLDGVPLIIAGAGGGAAFNAEGHGGVITEEADSSSGPGGIEGNGGQKGFITGDCGWAAGGGGFLGDGYGGTTDWDGGDFPGVLYGEGGGRSWANGGAGGINGGCDFVDTEGAWGCGGGGAGSYGGAGGGGYSGGGGGQYVDVEGKHGGGGGGSFNDGTDQVNTPANHMGDGEVIITELCSPIDITYTVADEIMGSDGEIDITVTGGAGAYTFDWDNDGTGDFDDTEDLIGITGGTYAVVVQDESVCDSVVVEVVVNSQVGVNEIEGLSVNIYPNPIVTEVTIELSGDFAYTIYTAKGEVVISSTGYNKEVLNLDQLPAGIYLMEIVSNNQGQSVQLIKK